ncbi:MAG: hypothetical protein CSA49_03865 [Gammaproteobacteria bacterium]|nr:MAG: hypothetical protein CSA49_03865 [Gammaproteobacteria bacterium]
MNRQLAGWVLVVLFGVWFSTVASAQVSVVTSIRPLALIAEEVLAPINPQIEVIVPQSASPHGFSLKPSHLQAILSAPALVWLGPSFEPYLEKAIQKRQHQQGVLVVEHLKGIRLLQGRAAEQVFIEHAHIEGPLKGSSETSLNEQHHHHHHSDSGYDPHLWWSSANAMIIASAIARETAAQHPEYKSRIENSLAAFKARMAQQKQAINTQPASSTASFVMYHDSLLYLEQELARFSKRRVTWAPEAKPSIKDMLAVKKLLNSQQAQCLIVEPNINPRFLHKVKPRNAVQVFTIDPLGWDAKSYSGMWANAANILVECSQHRLPGN